MIIMNDGELELEALTLLGASSKEGDTTKIGFFGSGNKYAIATLLRNNIFFTIFSGLKEIVFTTKEVTFRGETFKQVIINDIPTSITTRMGPQWEPWYAVREFICNAIDEGGYELNPENAKPKENKTLIYIEDNEAIQKYITDIEEYILTDNSPQIKLTDKVSLVNRKFNIYRKGVKIKPEGMDPTSVGAYNILDIDITESRIVKSQWELYSKVGEAISTTNNKDYIKQVLIAFLQEDSFEANCRFYFTPSLAWYEVLKDSSIAPFSAKKVMPIEDHTHYVFLPPQLCEQLAIEYPTLRIWGEKNEVGWEEDPDADITDIVECIVRMERAGLIEKYPPIKVGTFKDLSILGVYNTKKEEIWISKNYSQGQLPSLLYEEYCHSLGYSDGSREFDSFLIDKLLSAYKII